MDKDPPPAAPASPSKRQPTAPNFVYGITSEPGRRVYGSRVLGDIDGDGFDDFVVLGEQGVQGGTLDSSLETAVHLFYGKPAFPSQLSTAAANAKFTACSIEPIGDVNGDGLDDFSFVDLRGTRLVFGRKERLTNLADLDRASGAVWDGPTDPSESHELWALRAGDLNGDGFDDLLLAVNQSVYDEKTDEFSISDHMYLMWGRAKGWPSGKFDPAWVAATLDSGSPTGFEFYALSPIGPVDLDSDGFADLLAMRRTDLHFVAFYGAPDRFSNLTSPLVPDVEWDVPSRTIMPIGDFDGDGFVDLASFRFSAVTGGDILVHYGGPTRWLGKVKLTADLQLTSTSWLSQLATTGDVNGDALPDLLVASPNYGDPVTGAIFVLRGSGRRQLGARTLGANDTLMVGPGVTHRPGDSLDGLGAMLGGELDATGDIDGDGSSDVLAGAPGLSELDAPMGEGGVFLIPSAPMPQ
ncbi:MAG TPA: VCBS repeat-containing protein [Polyangiales bacterium]|nr:VCBS repeat-containing protein [Polyangiales bacterium]